MTFYHGNYGKRDGDGWCASGLCGLNLSRAIRLPKKGLHVYGSNVLPTKKDARRRNYMNQASHSEHVELKVSCSFSAERTS